MSYSHRNQESNWRGQSCDWGQGHRWQDGGRAYGSGEEYPRPRRTDRAGLGQWETPQPEKGDAVNLLWASLGFPDGEGEAMRPQMLSIKKREPEDSW